MARERDWYEIRAEAGSDHAEVFIYDQIGEGWFTEGVTAKRFAQELAALKVTTIDLRLNSPGGSVFDGTAIANAIERHPATVTAHVDGLAASIASVIALAADRVVFAANALFMIHEPRGGAWGTREDMEKMADVLAKITDVMVGIYDRRSALTEDEIRAAMQAETWYTAEEALEVGFADEITEPAKVAAAFDLVALGYRPPAAAIAALAPTSPATPAVTTEGDTVSTSTAPVAEATDTPPVPHIPRATVQDPFPYRPNEGGFFRDLINSKNDPEAAERFRRAGLMIEAAQVSTDTAEVIPTIYRPDLYVGQLGVPRVVIDSFSQGTLDGPNPFRIPQFETAAGLNAPHVEGTNPTDGTIAFDEKIITPAARSGQYTGSREQFEGSNPAIDAIVMNAIREEYALETETAAITAYLAGATAGTVVDISDGVTMQVRDRFITFQTNRKRAAQIFLAGATLFSELAKQVDSTGRPLNPSYGPVNASGVVGPAMESIEVAGRVTPLVPILTGGLLGVPSDAWTWESGLRFWRFEEVAGPANIRIAAFGYVAHAVLRGTGLLKFATQA
jgi:ATP-dependent Clp protease, protease subunit